MAIVIGSEPDKPRRRHGRAVVAFLFAAIVAGLAAPAAEAKIWFGDMQGRELAWGQRVSSTIAGCPGNDSCRAAVKGVAVALRRGPGRRTAHRGGPPHRLGRVSGSGRLTFLVPHVRVGRYELVARLKIGDRRRWMPASGRFRVIRGASLALHVGVAVAEARRVANIVGLLPALVLALVAAD
jgi:hypothetical protein